MTARQATSGAWASPAPVAHSADGVRRSSVLEPVPAAVVDALAMFGAGVERAAFLAARRIVLAAGERIRHGGLALEDPEGSCTFGAPAIDLPTVRLRVRDLRFYAYVLLWGARGAGEAYALGFWHTDDPVRLVRLFARNVAALEAFDQALPRPWRLAERLRIRLGGSIAATRRDVQAHYDLGNDFYALWLDETRSYSCALFEHEGMTLAEASLAKIDRILAKLDLRPGMRLLEIGTGWGALALRAAKRHGCSVVTTSISHEQRAYVTAEAARLGLGDRVQVLGLDYRELDVRALSGPFDALVSVEMIEAVGPGGLPPFFRKAASLLRPGGRMALQSITLCERRYAAAIHQQDFVKRYIFPGSCLPSLSALTAAAEEAGLRAVARDDIGAHYATTLAAWRERFLAARVQVEALGHSETFVRTWEWYLALCEGGFREGHLGTVQLAFMNEGIGVGR